MGHAALGVAVLAPTEGSARDQEKRRVRVVADRWFWFGLVLTFFGVILQPMGLYSDARRPGVALKVMLTDCLE